jgi:hypothetical protein
VLIDDREQNYSILFLIILAKAKWSSNMRGHW